MSFSFEDTAGLAIDSNLFNEVYDREMNSMVFKGDFESTAESELAGLGSSFDTSFDFDD